MSLYIYAKNELDMIYDKKALKSEMNKIMYNNILELIKVFGKQGHSGYSAQYCLQIFGKLARFKCITEITNNSTDWMEVDINMFQSRRISTCFSTDLKYYYDLDGEIVPKWKRIFVKNIKGMRLSKLKEEVKCT